MFNLPVKLLQRPAPSLVPVEPVGSVGRPVLPVRKVPRPVISLTGQSVAKAPRTKHQRAYLAALWFLGSLKFEPTMWLCSLVFGVSRQLIRKEIRKLQAETYATSRAEDVWDSMDWIARDAFVKNHGNQILRCLDRITSS